MKRTRKSPNRLQKTENDTMEAQQLIENCNAGKQQQVGNSKLRIGLAGILTMQVLFLMGYSGRNMFSTLAGQQLKASLPSGSSEQLVVSEGELMHVFFNDLKYRRVCSTVYKSILCLIIRYPFEVPLQDPTVTFPKPIEDRIYNTTNLIMVEGPYLENCRGMDRANRTKRELIWKCMEETARMDPTAVVSIYTRQSVGQTEEEWFGTGSEDQQRRIHEFFDKHVVIILGDSLSRYISFCMSTLFGDCQLTAESSFRCGPNAVASSANAGTQNAPKAISNDGFNSDISQTDADTTWLGFAYYFPLGVTKLRPAVNETPSMVETFRARGIEAGASWRSKHKNKLRPLSILFEFPIAHTQTYDMVQSNMGQIRYNQMKFTEMIMNITTPAARAELAELGFRLEHLVAYDGTPQHFPTDSGAYPDVRYQKSEAEFLQANGYPGWKPEFGSTCRGPLPPNSPLRNINLMSRHAFATQGFDTTRWYGTTWEFSNQFWWQETMWRVAQLDCTHPQGPVGGATCAHKYFLQAMVDGYYEEQKQR